jgi:hypothetical protein
LADWVAERWHAEVANRPLVNVHRRSLDDTWRQVFRHLGFDDEARLGPRHDELRAGMTTNDYLAASLPEATAQPAERRYSLSEIADACVYAEVPDSKYESITIALASLPEATAQPAEPIRDALAAAIYVLDKVRVFVTSRERINDPTGVNWFDEEVALCRKALASLPEATAQAPADHWPPSVLEALKFYADGDHFMRHDTGAWDSVSGEPSNFYEDDAGTATVEDGSVARAALEAAQAPAPALAALDELVALLVKLHPEDSPEQPRLAFLTNKLGAYLAAPKVAQAPALSEREKP